MGVLWLIGAIIAAASLYWLVVIGEGTYLGPWAVRLVYRLGAAHYDSVRASTHAADPALLLPVLREALAGVARPQVLDVATGTGRVPLLIAGEPGFDGMVVGLDLTEAMLDRARAKQAESCPQAPIRWVRAEAGRLAWPDASFDMVSCLEAIEYFPRPRRALAEMARVLRPGGALVISKWPDAWARALPGRALTCSALTRRLTGMGLAAITIRPWQPGNYELVTAKKC
ncbi:class I SAM-dependent methyltransferase [Oscillochloris sp. ZM17-4]|uniref:class I SAM-dependent methyltransferase n=1 Tax=Oscillochloris sp. ZM17-4 TaxID=2866714 RepID=UPI001C73238C|nr:class I SAM-dependent methyltransferase [Oscillochloris sp. ZM17-4]MBX0326498.1 class I SAM-dependent methyltransferase [Oscillochloris sp. ZM17-4]